ncbi:MAG: MFS transporter [Solirubrobacteraceae bacterium]|nr:MFS transporter [Patulibacter sp.]
MTPTTAHTDAPKRVHYQVTFYVLAAGVGAYALLQSLVTPVLPTIQAALHTSQTNVTWVLTAYLLSASILTPILGRLGDMFGKERMFVIAMVLLGVGCLLSAVAHSLGLMIVGRLIQGAGGGAMPLAFGIIRDEFPAEKVAGAVGSMAALVAAGAGLGVVLAGPIVDGLSYHWLFWLPLVVIVIAAVAAHLVIPETANRTPGKINWFTATLMSLWLAALLLGVSEASDWGWGSPKTIGLILLGLVLCGVWIAAEARSDNPLIDMKMMKIRAVWTNNLVAALFGFGMYAVFAFLPELLQTKPEVAGYGFGATITESGLMLLPMTVAMFIFGNMTGKLSARFGSKALVIGGSALGVVALLLLTFEHDHRGPIYVSMALMGVGFGLAFSAMSNLIVAAVSPQQTGVASGMNANIRTIGGALGAALTGTVVTSGASASGLPKEAGYNHGFLMLSIALILAALAALAIPAAEKLAAPHDITPEELPHAELALVAAGTLVGDDPE